MPPASRPALPSAPVGDVDASQPNAINDLGVIGGYSGGGYATEWSDNGSILWYSPDRDSDILAINASGAAVGYDGNNAVFWSPTGVETVLDSVGTIIRPEAFAINDSGRSIGENGYGGSTEWTKTGATIALGSLPGGTDGNELWAINDHDTAVGADLTKHGKVATLWSATGKAKNLQEFLGAGWSDTQANAINDAGDICGVGDHNNVQSAFELLWVPAAGSADNGSYINAASHNALAASAVHAPVTESAAHGFASVGHGPG